MDLEARASAIHQLRKAAGIIVKDLYTKAELIDNLRRICELGWISSTRSHSNAGAVGNLVEDLLGISENNLPMPNAVEWELKAQRVGKRLVASSLTTLFHLEPYPASLVTGMLLPKYGWPHKLSGSIYADTEMSFRQTLNGLTRTDRGFKMIVDDVAQQVRVSFDPSAVSSRHDAWKESLQQRIGTLGELGVQPYWTYKILDGTTKTKLLNCFYIYAQARRVQGEEQLRYFKVLMLRDFNFNKFIDALKGGSALVDFDARSGHNHGTKFRLRQSVMPTLYDSVDEVISIDTL